MIPHKGRLAGETGIASQWRRLYTQPLAMTRFSFKKINTLKVRFFFVVLGIMISVSPWRYTFILLGSGMGATGPGDPSRNRSWNPFPALCEEELPPPVPFPGEAAPVATAARRAAAANVSQFGLWPGPGAGAACSEHAPERGRLGWLLSSGAGKDIAPHLPWQDVCA